MRPRGPAWARERGDPQGTLLLIGQAMHDKDGRRSPESGNALWTNHEGGKGGWTSRSSPVPIRAKQLDHSPDYSSALLPSADGRHVLQIATDYDGPHLQSVLRDGPAVNEPPAPPTPARRRRGQPQTIRTWPVVHRLPRGAAVSRQPGHNVAVPRGS